MFTERTAKKNTYGHGRPIMGSDNATPLNDNFGAGASDSFDLRRF